MNRGVPINSINFTKMHGAGNDFIVIDNRSGLPVKNYPEFARKICERKFSIGADGLLLVEHSARADFKMVYYNSDGSRADFCGNGARCIAYYCFIKKIASRDMKFETDAGIVNAKVLDKKVNPAPRSYGLNIVNEGRRVKLQMPEPRDIRLDFNLKVIGRELKASFINTGVPHVVIFSSDVSRVDVQGLGRAIRNNPAFAPAGTNVNFVNVKNLNEIMLRTYERGVEGETYACGTGAVATAVIAGIKNLVKSPVNCITTGLEKLKVYFKLTETEKTKDLINPVCDVYLEGRVTVSFEGGFESFPLCKRGTKGDLN
ncbi:MAG: diaminopimelate epimerase [Elusimicrobiota bacterium]